MKIAVCIKRTPDSESRFRIAGSAAAIDESGLKFDMDDFAGYAVEAALQINEKAGGGETVVFKLVRNHRRLPSGSAITENVCDRNMDLRRGTPWLRGEASGKPGL